MPRYKQALESSTGPARVGDDVKTSRATPQSRPPIRTFVFDLAQEIDTTVREWALVAVAGENVRRRYRITFQAAWERVRGHEDALLANETYVEPFSRNMLTLERRSLVALRAEPLVHHLPAPCPQCDTLGLIRHDGQEEVRCSFCKVSWQANEYDRLVRILAWEQEQLAHA